MPKVFKSRPANGVSYFKLLDKEASKFDETDYDLVDDVEGFSNEFIHEHFDDREYRYE